MAIEIFMDGLGHNGSSTGTSGMNSVKSFLRDESAVSASLIFPFLTSVKLGTKKSADDYRTALKVAENHINNSANDILSKMSISGTQIELDLVTATVKDLGFEDGATFKDICERAAELGIELCPAEVGPALLLQYQNQPKNEWFIIAMETISDSGGRPSIFVVGYGNSNSSRWLSSRWGRRGIVWGSGNHLVFVRCSK